MQDRVLYTKWLPLYQVVYNLNYFGAPESPVKDGSLYAVGDEFFVPGIVLAGCATRAGRHKAARSLY